MPLRRIQGLRRRALQLCIGVLCIRRPLFMKARRRVIAFYVVMRNRGHIHTFRDTPEKDRSGLAPFPADVHPAWCTALSRSPKRTVSGWKSSGDIAVATGSTPPCDLGNRPVIATTPSKLIGMTGPDAPMTSRWMRRRACRLTLRGGAPLDVVLVVYRRAAPILVTIHDLCQTSARTTTRMTRSRRLVAAPASAS